MMTESKHFIFDLDGTLVNSLPVVEQVLNELRHELGLGSVAEEEVKQTVSLGGIDMIRAAFPGSQVAAESMLVKFRARYSEILTPVHCVYEGVSTILNELKVHNHILSICTNKPRKLATKVLEETGLAHYFERVVAGDDLGTRKPHLANFLACVQTQSIDKSNIFIVGDSTIDQRMALAADVPFIFFTGGYDDGVKRNLVLREFAHYANFPTQL